jgi:hypothetical protein
MSFLLALLAKLGELLAKVAPILFAYKAGQYKTEHDFEAALNKVLEEDNEELRKLAVTSDALIADSLRRRADKKRKDSD